MKSVLISIKPQWCELIASHEKTIEVRKTVPKIETPFKCYIYKTKDAKYWNDFYNGGKVIGEFICDKIITVDCDSVGLFDKGSHEYVGDSTCVSRDEFWQYARGLCAYGWHISDLKIYDEPKEITDFYHTKEYMKEFLFGITHIECGIDDLPLPIKKPPQSWCYVEETNVK